MDENKGTEKTADEKKRYTRQELIDLLLQKQEELGRVPTRKDMPEGTLAAYKSEFNKWVYALEAAGVRTPSEKTLERRKKKQKRSSKAKNKANQENQR